MVGAFSLVTVFLIPNVPAGLAVYFIANGRLADHAAGRDPSSGRCPGADPGGGRAAEATASAAQEEKRRR